MSGESGKRNVTKLEGAPRTTARTPSAGTACARDSRGRRRDASTRRVTSAGSNSPRAAMRSGDSSDRISGCSSRRSQFFIGMLKPSFFRVRMRSGRTPRIARLRIHLRSPLRIFRSPGHRKRQLHDVGVEKRRARLERRRHAHAIDLHQDVVGEIERQVGIELPVEQIVVAEARQRLAHRRVDIRRASAPGAAAGA